MDLIADKQCIIFDMDGVLVQSSAIHGEAFSQVFQSLGLLPVDYREIAGQRTDEVFREVLTRYKHPYTESLISELTQQKRRLVHQLSGGRLPLAPGAVQVVKQLATRHKLALASSASTNNINQFLEESLLAGFFEVVIHGEEVSEAKPAPAIYQLTCNRLDCSTDQCCVIEDSHSGIKAAKAAGLDVVAVVGTLLEQDLLTYDIPIIHSLNELI